MKKKVSRVKVKSSVTVTEVAVDRAEDDSNFEKENLQIQLEEISDQSGHRIANLSGRVHSLIAFKNETSFAIGTPYQGLTVVEEGRQVFLDRLSRFQGRLEDLVYIDHLHCYILNFRVRIRHISTSI